ncbi:unnamed protein product [Caretta caretta]
MWKSMKDQDKILSYVDDILIATNTREENLQILDADLDKIKNTGFIINPIKAQLVLPEVKYLAYPKPDQPYQLQQASKQGINAVLLQDQGSSLKPIAYGTVILSEVKKQFNTCEKEVLALVWSLGHWEYLIDMPPIVLKTTHTPL